MTRPRAHFGYPQIIIERFWSKVDRRGPDECWPWIGTQGAPGVTGDRYGNFAVQVDGKATNFRANRLAWMLWNGAIPDGQVIRHTCDNTLCVNPDHLIPGTQKDNAADCMERMRHTIGERNRHAQLTTEAVLDIRRSDEHDTVLMARYGVGYCAIYNARTGRKWKHLPGARPDFYSRRRRQNNKLTDTQRAEIVGRHRTGEALKAIAKDYGISPGYVSTLAGKNL